MKKKNNFNILNLNKILLFLTLLLFQLSPTQNIAVLIIGLIVLVNTYTFIKKNLKVKKKNILMVFVMILFTFYMIRTPYILGTEAQVEVFWLLFGVLIFVAIITSGLTIESLLFIVIINGLIGGGLTIISYFTAFYFGGMVSPPYAGTRAVGGFDGPNELASYQLLIASISFGVMVHNKYNINKFYLILSIIISVITIFLTYSRGGIIGLGILTIIFYVFYTRKNFKKTMLYLIPITFILIITFHKYGLPLISQFNNVRRNRSERNYLTEEVVHLFTEKPIFGWGLGSFGEISAVRNAVPHNEFYLFLISGGIISIFLFVAFLSWTLGLSIKKRLYPVAFFLIVFITQELTFNHLIRGRVSILFWIVISLIFINNSFKKCKDENIEQRKAVTGN